MGVKSSVLNEVEPGPVVVLASSSAWRRAILSSAGVRCIAAASRVDESKIGGSTPVEVARARALAKARCVAADHPGALVIGADQVVHLDGEVIGKPRGDDDWLARLRAFRGRTHSLTTAVALLTLGEPEEVFEVHSAVRFRADVGDAELQAYIEHGEARGCAGGYMVEKRGAWLIEAVEGDWTNVVGLPVFEVITRLRARGYRFSPTGFGDAMRKEQT